MISPVEETAVTLFWSKRIRNVPKGVHKDVLGHAIALNLEQSYIED